MNSVQDIWTIILDELAKQLTETSMTTWFGDCQAVDMNGDSLVLLTTNAFKKLNINRRYGDIIKAVLNDLFSSDSMNIVVVASQEELDDYYGLAKATTTLPEMDGYTFDNFIVGNSNKFAHAAALGATENPGSKAYNPLFIYGNSGLGKTHLLMAIGSAIHEKNPAAKIVYIKGDEFTNQMIQSIKSGTAEDFRQKYRNADLFLVDDIQFISGKEGTQEEFFHTFNNIYEAGHQICITSDRPPKDMLTLDDRLRTRFEGSLMADVQPPDLETRIAIINNKAMHLGMRLDDEVVQFIAKTITSNIRQIEGVVKKLTAYSNIEHGHLTIDTVKKVIGEVSATGTYVPSPDTIIDETARYFSVYSAEVKGQRRSKNIATARHIAIYLVRTLTSLSLNDIGKYFEDRNHATVLASINKIESLLDTDKEITGAIRDITSNINSRQHD